MTTPICSYLRASHTPYLQATHKHMFSASLPKPKHTAIDSIRVVLPKKLDNQSILPRNLLDSNDPQANLPKSVKADTQNAVLQLVFNPDGSIDYPKTLTLASGVDTSVQATYEDTIPLKIRYPRLKHHFPAYTLETCPDDSLQRCVAETKEVIMNLLAKVSGVEEKVGDVTMQQYASSGLKAGETKHIHITNLKEDPMLPPKHKLRNNRESQAAPPPPVLKAQSAEKITKDIKDKWHIPSSVSNWKNNQGFTISLDKRVNAASGGAQLGSVDFNFENFSRLSLALENADSKARKELEEKHAIRRQMLQQENTEGDSSRVRELLEKARQRKRIDESEDQPNKRRQY